MERKASVLSAAVGAVVRGRYRKVAMNQETLAGLTGIPLTTIQRLIAGKAEFDTEQLYAVAVALNTSVASILSEAEHDIGFGVSDGAATTVITSHEDRYLRGDYGIAAERRTDDEDEEPDDT